MSEPLIQQGGVIWRGDTLLYQLGAFVFTWPGPGHALVEVFEFDCSVRSGIGKSIATFDPQALFDADVDVEFSPTPFRDACRAFLTKLGHAPLSEVMTFDPAEMRFRCTKCRREVPSTDELRYGHCIDCLAEGHLEAAQGAPPMQLIEPTATAELDAEVPRLVGNFECDVAAGAIDVAIQVVQVGDRRFAHVSLEQTDEDGMAELSADDAAKLSAVFGHAEITLRRGPDPNGEGDTVPQDTKPPTPVEGSEAVSEPPLAPALSAEESEAIADCISVADRMSGSYEVYGGVEVGKASRLATQALERLDDEGLDDEGGSDT